MFGRDGLLRNRWESPNNDNANTPNHNTLKFRDLLERYPPNLDLFQTAVYSIASSKHSPYKDANSVWELDWEEFISVSDWVDMCEAAEAAAHRDAATNRK